jgi:hypothetical protein
MTPAQLRKRIAALPEHPPFTTALELALLMRGRWYSSQREHWLCWLAEYSGSGAYGRRGRGYDAAFAYNHCGCPPMVLWLGEATGVDDDLVVGTAASARHTPGTFSAKCAAIRRIMPWSLVEERL